MSTLQSLGNKRVFGLALVALVALGVSTRGVEAAAKVTWSAGVKQAEVRRGETVLIAVTATLESGWHLYSTTTPPGGPKPTRFTLEPGGPAAPAGPVYQPKPERKLDEVFGVDTEYFEGAVEFLVPVKIAEDAPAGPNAIRGSAAFMVCDPKQCIPGTAAWEASLTVVEGPARAEFAGLRAPSGLQPGPDVTIATADAKPAAQATPAEAAPRTPSGDAAGVARARSEGLFAYLVLAVTVGFASLLTPCVFPMIPITVSYFTKSPGHSRARGVLDAGVYAAAIIATFTLLGVVVAVVFGAAGIARFAANPWINLLLAAIFVVLALNLFGVFEVLVPGSVLTSLNRLSEKGGMLGTVLMGFTFTLTSFTCTMPFVGTLLVTTAQGDWVWPLVGMLGYSTAFALPFFLLALFPQALVALPRAGGWMVSLKVVMGFLELAAAVKFISNVDLVWGYQKITKELFLSVWIAIAFVAAFYLLGKIRLPHERAVESVGVGRMLASMGFLSIAFYLFTGLLGSPLGELDAFLPPISSNQRAAVASSGGRGAGELTWESDYGVALERARATGTPIMIDFTGYACTNCRWMEANIFPTPEVRGELERFVRVQLYTDGQGEKYDRNREFQETRFGTVALPLYVVIDPATERETARFEGLTRDASEFVAFLRGGRNPNVAANRARP
jgi:thiol:disulfide interchange protein DsbD